MSNEPLIRLSDRVSYWQGDLDRHEQTNVGVIVADGTAIVIDANFEEPARRILATIQDRERATVTHQVNTHYHADHSLGNVVYSEAGAMLVGADGQRDELLAKGQEDSRVQTGVVPDRLYPVTLEFSDTIAFHQFELQLMAVGPAHSRGDLLAWLPKDGILFVGDLAVAWDHGNNFSDPDADIEGWIRGLERCQALRPQVVAPAHGRLSGPDVLDIQRAFISDLWECSLAAVDRGDDLVDPLLERRFLDDYPEFAVNSKRFGEMSRSMLAAVKNRSS